jgi:hypothetical protein
VAEAAAGQLDHLQAERGGQRPHHQGGAVGDAAGGVLVDRRPGQAVEVEPVAGGDHGLGEGLGLPPGEAAQVAGHEEGGHLVVGQLAGGVGEHERAQVGGVDLAAVPLAGDDVDRPRRSPIHRGTPSGLPGPLRPIHRGTPSGFPGPLRVTGRRAA